LSATVSGAEELRKKCFPGRPEYAKVWVRTYGSVMAWGNRDKLRVPELVFDEMAAVPCAEVLFMIFCFRPKFARGYGDSKQMEWKPFVAGVVARWADATIFADVRFLGITHRCRLSIVAAVKDHYPEADLAVCVDCCPHVSETEEGGIEVVRVGSLAEVPILPGVQYLGFSQLESSELRSKLQMAGILDRRDKSRDIVSTVAESQGITRETVFLVRTSPRVKKGSLYSEANRVNVGVSRAKVRVVYYTVSDEKDLVVTWAGYSKDEERRAIIRGNSERYAREMATVGKEAFYAQFFCMERLKYM